MPSGKPRAWGTGARGDPGDSRARTGHHPTVRPVPDPPPFARDLCSVGVTGTNGKTTITTLVAALLGVLARPVAKLTTLGCFLDDERLTVPPHYEGFIATLERCLARGGRYAAIEFTSEALSLGAARGWPCRVGVFSNFSRDHLDAHASEEHYLASKAQLFVTLAAGGTAVLNGCDEGAALIAEVVPASVSRLTYGLASRGAPWTALDLAASAVTVDWSGTRIELSPSSRIPAGTVLAVRAVGEIFAENALAALAAGLAVGVPLDAALETLAGVATPPGRFERVGSEPDVVVDYAHTPDALARTLTTARALTRGRVTVVFGAGGERDRDKRPLLGAAAEGADRVILTSDNPRGEDPRAIACAIREGIDRRVVVEEELDRARAIERAVHDAGEHDLILVAGKGHETEQITAAGRRPFSDVEVVRAAMQSRSARIRQ